MIIGGHTYSPHHVLTMVFIRLLLWHGRMDACCTLTHPILINSLDLEFGTVGMDGCCAPDVILQSLHLVCNSSAVVNLDSHIDSAAQGRGHLPQT